MVSSAGSGWICAQNLPSVLFSSIPEARAEFGRFSADSLALDDSPNGEDLELHQFVLEVFTLPIMIPCLVGGREDRDLLNRSLQLVDLLLLAGNSFIQDLVWFEIFSPTLSDVSMLRNFWRLALPRTRQDLEEFARSSGVDL